MLEDAIIFATQQHKGQIDRSGIPVIYHPLRVMISVRNALLLEKYQIVAILHDVVEDTDITVEDIDELFGAEIAHAVDAITRRPEEPYFEEYIPRVLSNPIARTVKYHDAGDNIERPGQSSDSLYRKYLRVRDLCHGYETLP